MVSLQQQTMGKNFEGEWTLGLQRLPVTTPKRNSIFISKISRTVQAKEMKPQEFYKKIKDHFFKVKPTLQMSSEFCEHFVEEAVAEFAHDVEGLVHEHLDPRHREENTYLFLKIKQDIEKKLNEWKRRNK
jgi:hypothetical protein